MTTTAIEWADAVWNPTTGCDTVSDGCDNCYARTMAKRLKGMGSAKYQTDGDPVTSGPGFGVASHEDALTAPLRWRKPRRVFVNSMSDLFHKDISGKFIHRVFAVMAATPQHTYQILTKRHARMRSLLNNIDFAIGAMDESLVVKPVAAGELPHGDLWPLPNVWLGVSVESQRWADIRIPALLDTPAAVRFLSCEPLLGPVDLSEWLAHRRAVTDPSYDAPDGAVVDGMQRVGDQWHRREQLLHWVIAGGESGHGARPMHPDWARTIRDQCVTAGVPFLFKQWGMWAPDGNDIAPAGLAPKNNQMVLCSSKKLAGRELDGRTWDQFPARAA